MPVVGATQTGVVEAALEKVLSSTTLRSSARLRQFLTYIVRHAQAGNENRLKEYTIGVEVFDRGPRFNPRCDAIVRVEAIKLREKLGEYYLTEGASDIVTISIPKGGYRPVFDVQEDPPAAMFDDPENVCCQAESLLLRSTARDTARTRHFVHRAIARWPELPQLHVALASATLAELEMELISPAEGVPLLQHSASRALSLDATRGDAHFLARVAEIRHSDKSVAIHGARLALRYAPTSATAHFWMARVLAADCKMGDALTHMQTAVRLRPHALFFHTWRAVALFLTGQDAAALHHLRDLVEFEPRDYLANYWLGRVAAHAAGYEEARDAARRAYEVSHSSQALAKLGFVEAQTGRAEAAEAILQTLTETAATEYVSRFGLAAIHLALGRVACAASELTRAHSEGDWQLGWAGSDPRLA